MAGNRVLSSAAWALALGFRAVPERSRLRAAVSVARRLEPLIEGTAAYRERCTLKTESLREWSLALLLSILTRHGTTFDPAVRVEGAACLPAPGTGPLLMVAPHLMLNLVLMRVLVDGGYDPVVVAADPQLRIPGRRTSPRLLQPSGALFFQVRRLFERGQTVAAMIDRGEPHGRNRTFDTPHGAMMVSEALIQLAVRLGVPVGFMATTLDARSRIVSHLALPALGSTTAREIVEDFARFVDDLPRAAVTSAGTRW